MFSPSGHIKLKSFEQVLEYYRSSIEYAIFEKRAHDDLKDDLFQEISLALFYVWQKYQSGDIKYLTSSYILSTVRNSISNYLLNISRELNQNPSGRKRSLVVSLEQSHNIDFGNNNVVTLPNLMPIVNSQEKSFEIRRAEEKVLAQLDLKEKTFYLLFKQGYGRNEIAKKMKNKNTHWQTDTIKKIRQLFIKYL